MARLADTLSIAVAKREDSTLQALYLQEFGLKLLQNTKKR